MSFFLATSSTAGSGPVPVLICSGPVEDAAGLTGRLCDALRQAFLEQYGFAFATDDAGTGPVLRLDIIKAAPSHLSARLLWSASPGQTTPDPVTDPVTGPLMELTIMDRDTFPDTVLLDFARNLLVTTSLPPLQKRALQP